jgi:hypothetical protein
MQTQRRTPRRAPVVAVRGNNDRGPWAWALLLCATLEIAGVHLLVVHDRKDAKPDAPRGAGRRPTPAPCAGAAGSSPATPPDCCAPSGSRRARAGSR